MQLTTTRFGQISIDPLLIFTFPEGLPGFKDENRFALLSIGLADTPFIWMQSIANHDLCFLLVDPQAAFANYTVAVSESETELLQGVSDTDMQVLCLVTVVDGDLQQATVNLRAPLLFNSQSKLALQSISDNDAYSTRQPLFGKEGV